MNEQVDPPARVNTSEPDADAAGDGSSLPSSDPAALSPRRGGKALLVFRLATLFIVAAAPALFLLFGELDEFFVVSIVVLPFLGVLIVKRTFILWNRRCSWADLLSWPNTFLLIVAMTVAASAIAFVWGLLPEGIDDEFTRWGSAVYVLIGALMALREYLWRSPRAYTVVSRNDLDKWVRSLFDSEEFLTPLRATLPSSKTDRLHGFDHIPYLLHAVDGRRKRFGRTSTVFLGATMALGLVFSAVLIVFGYIVIRESAVGFPQDIKGLRDATDDLRVHALAVERLSTNGDFTTNHEDQFAKLRKWSSTPNDESLNSIRDEAEKAITAAIAADSISQVIDAWTEARSKLQSVGQSADKDALSNLRAIVKDGRDAARTFGTKFIRAGRSFASTLEAIRSLIETAKVSAEKPENRIADLLKRVFVSLVIATFFIAILRYTVGMYRQHLQEVVAAERDGLAMRRFYVAFRCAGEDTQQQKAVLQEFMRSGGVQAGAPAGSNADRGKSDEYEILKIILEAISKKI